MKPKYLNIRAAHDRAFNQGEGREGVETPNIERPHP
jgi:hypothetical protein